MFLRLVAGYSCPKTGLSTLPLFARLSAMAATAMIPAQGMTLSDAPDNNGKPLQCMQIEMSQEVIDELVQAARSEKKPQIFFGRQPVRTNTSQNSGMESTS